MFERQSYREEGNGVVQSNKNIVFQDISYQSNKPGFAGMANSVESGNLDKAEVSEFANRENISANIGLGMVGYYSIEGRGCN
jgi:hypothetical protein